MKEVSGKCSCTMQAVLDGGLSWLVVGSSFMQQFITMGIHNVFGLFYIDLLKEFKGDKATTALVASVSFGIMYVIGPLTTIFCHKYGNRTAALIGAVIQAVGLLLSSFVTNLTTMYLTYSLVMALGSSLCYYTSILILEEYFLRRLATSNGIALAGGGVGTLALSPLVEYFLSTHQWRKTMRILSGTASLLLICSVIHYLVPSPKQSKDDELNEEKDETKFFDKSLFQNKAYVVYVTALSLVLFGFYVPFVHLVRHCQDLNISKKQGSILVGYLAISQTIGKIGFGRLADHPRINRITLLQYALLVCSIATTLLPILTSIQTITVYCWVYGIHDGCFVVLIAVITGDLVGREKMALAYGMVYFFSCITMTVGPPIAGLIYDVTGTYNSAFFMAGAFTFVGVCLLFLVPVLLPSEIVQQWKARPSLEEVTITSLEGNTDDNHEMSPVYYASVKKEVPPVLKEKDYYEITTKSGSRRLVKDKTPKDKISKQQENRFSWMIERYFSMEHLVDQKGSLISVISKVYSRENVFPLLSKNTSNVRETDV